MKKELQHCCTPPRFSLQYNLTGVQHSLSFFDQKILLFIIIIIITPIFLIFVLRVQIFLRTNKTCTHSFSLKDLSDILTVERLLTRYVFFLLLDTVELLFIRLLFQVYIIYLYRTSSLSTAWPCVWQTTEGTNGRLVRRTTHTHRPTISAENVKLNTTINVTACSKAEAVKKCQRPRHCDAQRHRAVADERREAPTLAKLTEAGAAEGSAGSEVSNEVRHGGAGEQTDQRCC